MTIKSVLEKRLGILEKEVNILDSTLDIAFKSPLSRPMEEVLYLRLSKFRKCADLYSKISKM